MISDYEDQPLIIGSHLGTYALVTVGRMTNLDELAAELFRGRVTHFAEMGGDADQPDRDGGQSDQSRGQSVGGDPCGAGEDPRVLFAVAVDRRRDLCGS